MGARAAPDWVRSAIRTSCAALGVGIPVSVVVILLATQPVLAQPAWQITKTHNGNATRGQQFVFTITVTNAGNAATSGMVCRRV